MPLDAIAPERLRFVRPIALPRLVGPGRCAHIAQIIAPDRYFALDCAGRDQLGTLITALARRVEALLVRRVFPEMTRDVIPVVFHNDADPGDACERIETDDLTGSYVLLAPQLLAIPPAVLSLGDPALSAA